MKKSLTLTAALAVILTAPVAGVVRRQRAAAPRDAQPRPAGQGAQLGLALTRAEPQHPSAWGA
ncbi:hypothetical protein [Corallococcus llansteffanensis]|nr:hypothetical protein [Corallococcus llansteffanensis]